MTTSSHPQHPKAWTARLAPTTTPNWDSPADISDCSCPPNRMESSAKELPTGSPNATPKVTRRQSFVFATKKNTNTQENVMVFNSYKPFGQFPQFGVTDADASVARIRDMNERLIESS